MGRPLAVPKRTMKALMEEDSEWIEFFFHPEEDLIWSRRSGDTAWSLLDDDEARLMAPQLSSPVTRFHFAETRFHFSGVVQAEVANA